MTPRGSSRDVHSGRATRSARAPSTLPTEGGPPWPSSAPWGRARRHSRRAPAGRIAAEPRACCAERIPSPIRPAPSRGPIRRRAASCRCRRGLGSSGSTSPPVFHTKHVRPTLPRLGRRAGRSDTGGEAALRGHREQDRIVRSPTADRADCPLRRASPEPRLPGASRLPRPVARRRCVAPANSARRRATPTRHDHRPGPG